MSENVTHSQEPEEDSTPFSMGEVSGAEPVPSTGEPHQGPEIEALSVSDKMIGLYTEPETVYQNLKQAGPRITDWVVPMLCMLVILAIATMQKFSDPEFTRQMAKTQEERFEIMVAEGDMTQEQSDAAISQMQGMSGFMMAISIAGVLVGTPIVFLLIALFYWLVMRFAFKGSATFYLTFSAITLTVYITMLDPLIALILGYATGNPFATLSPGLFFTHDTQNKLYLAMTALKPIQIWGMVVLSIGFTKIAEISKPQAYGLVFGAWIVVSALSVIFGDGQMYM